MNATEKIRAGRNRTLVLTDEDKTKLREKLITDKTNLLSHKFEYLDKTINADLLTALPLLPDEFADLIIIDPPYNLTKNFGGKVFNERKDSAYEEYLETWFSSVCKKLKSNGSLYLCGDWKCTAALQRVMEKELTVLNRIT